ncbi:protein of unknown function [Vibrio tapetis subsp. tapetis]|uniref:Uncharacterized protein n=1 Tax=Vibrio tapetis subsp. tapetis TaxID=1671868 RepID=A0A2N8ZK38_9VIBR|nr:protein of unknown function [Vibrio tapetis subsp. tapetis]
MINLKQKSGRYTFRFVIYQSNCLINVQLMLESPLANSDNSAGQKSTGEFP